jgi:hypothetical protein
MRQNLSLDEGQNVLKPLQYFKVQTYLQKKAEHSMTSETNS